MSATRTKVKDLELIPIQLSGTWSSYTANIERLSSYTDWQVFLIKTNVTNNNAPSININGLGDIGIVDADRLPVTSAVLLADTAYFLQYDASLNKFVVIGWAGWTAWGGWSTQTAQLVFDDPNNALPLTTATQIDGVTVSSWDIVYVKDSWDNTQDGKFYDASVSAGNITWTENTALNSLDPVYVEKWLVYWGKVNYFTPTQFWDILANSITVNQIVSDNYNQQHIVDAIFDNPTADLPLVNTTQIDWYTVVDWDRVYVKDALNWSTEWKMYQASVDGGGNITRSEVATVKPADTVYSNNWSTYWNTVNDASSTTVTNVSNLSTNNIITNKYNLNYNVDLVFDDLSNDLPTTNATQIDWVTLANSNTYTVYVKNCSDPLKVGKIFDATVDWSGNITWTELYTLKPWDTYYSANWNTYWDTINNYNDTTTITTTINWNYIVPTNETTTPTGNLTAWSFNLVTYVWWDVTLTLPDANSNEWATVTVKKWTWEDVNVITIWSAGWLVEWFPTATFNFDRQVYSFVAISWNRYVK